MPSIGSYQVRHGVYAASHLGSFFEGDGDALECRSEDSYWLSIYARYSSSIKISMESSTYERPKNIQLNSLSYPCDASSKYRVPAKAGVRPYILKCPRLATRDTSRVQSNPSLPLRGWKLHTEHDGLVGPHFTRTKPWLHTTIVGCSL